MRYERIRRPCHHNNITNHECYLFWIIRFEHLNETWWVSQSIKHRYILLKTLDDYVNCIKGVQSLDNVHAVNSID